MKKDDDPVDGYFWISNPKGRFSALEQHLDIAKELGLTPAIVGDIFTQGKNPVESLMLALERAEKFVIGYDTYHFFSAMLGSRLSKVAAEKQCGKGIWEIMKPYEKSLQELYGKTDIFFRGGNEMVFPMFMPPNACRDSSFTFSIKDLLRKGRTEEAMLESMKENELDRIICGGVSQSGKPNPNIICLGSGSSEMLAFDTREGKLHIQKAGEE